MNIKFSASLLTLSLATSFGSIDITPAFADAANGASDVGNNTSSITNVVNSVQSQGSQPSLSPEIQSAINKIINKLEKSPTILAAISGGSTAPLLVALLPPDAGIDPNGKTTIAANKAVAAAKGIVSVNGVVNPIQVNNAIDAFNDYARALVAEVGGVKALEIISTAPGSLYAVLSELAQAGKAKP